jgi:hypothetical protein
MPGRRAQRAAQGCAPQQNHTYTHISKWQQNRLWKCFSVQYLAKSLILFANLQTLQGQTVRQAATFVTRLTF